MRRMDAEVDDAVAERVAPLVALVGRRLDVELVRDHALPRKQARREVRQLP